MNIEKLFDGIAFRYDLFNSISSFGIDKIWRHKLALLVKQPQNINLLDVAVGTGAVLLSIFEHKCDVNYTAGIDVSDKMLAIAEKKLAKLCRVGFSPRGSSSISLKRADAVSIPFENNFFDVVTCAFGVRNFEDLTKGLSEMLRVLKPGGKMFILEFSLPPNPVIRFFYLIYLKVFIPLLGLLITGRFDAYKYLSRTIQSFPSGENFCRILRDTGFQNVKAERKTIGVVTFYSANKSA